MLVDEFLGEPLPVIHVNVWYAPKLDKWIIRKFTSGGLRLGDDEINFDPTDEYLIERYENQYLSIQRGYTSPILDLFNHLIRGKK